MIIILDSSTIIADFRMMSTEFRLLFEALTFADDILLKVPQVVIDEVENKYRERIEERFRVLNKEVQETSRLLGLDLPKVIDIETLDTYYRSYITYLHTTLKKVKAQIAKYPSVTHKRMVRWALSRKKPFNAEKGSGYRDALIWESVLSTARISNDKIAFITLNSRDFASEGDPNQFHQDILATLQEQRIGVDKVELFSSLAKFNEKYVKPMLTRLDVVLNKIRANEYLGIDFQNTVSVVIPKLLNNTVLSPRDMVMPLALEYLIITRARRVGHIEFTKVLDMSSSQIFITAQLFVSCKFELFLKDFSSVSSSGKALLLISFIFDTKQKAITSVEKERFQIIDEHRVFDTLENHYEQLYRGNHRTGIKPLIISSEGYDIDYDDEDEIGYLVPTENAYNADYDYQDADDPEFIEDTYLSTRDLE